jgi:hypothetical protein
MAAVTSPKVGQGAKPPLLRAVLAGFVISVATYLAALACAAAQLHSAVALLLWPSSVLGKLLDDGTPVTFGSPSPLWQPLAHFALAWLLYSVASFFWLSRKETSADV